MLAPEPDSVEPTVIVIVVFVGTVATINLLSSNVDAEKPELVAELKASNKTISPLLILCADAKVIVTVADPLVVVNADVNVVVLLRGVIS